MLVKHVHYLELENLSGIPSSNSSHLCELEHNLVNLTLNVLICKMEVFPLGCSNGILYCPHFSIDHTMLELLGNYFVFLTSHFFTVASPVYDLEIIFTHLQV